MAQDQNIPEPSEERRQNLGASDQHQGKLPAEQQGGEPTRARPTFRPRCDIAETEEGLVLIADVPGATQEGLDIQLERRELTIRAEVLEDAPEGMSPLHREYQVGDYERRFTLTGDFDIDRIEADLSNGVLTIRLPRAAQPEARRIEVRAG
ncbi:Hsp20/alpha crystallin family protein [Paracoccus sp. MC1854]|uniref:Hsp20/alpha crystallin family protein n=1 Tax=Paracoccus sp. MC1854 TaxID=2760306 RepID=UPI001603C1F2|nr:Hsp20/alpha crystallin family protein [Paracoccus sp. MC1854]MBB1493033.1 Hsp20/alpha crystallin family protein [Paracoccus sp. MC1854]